MYAELTGYCNTNDAYHPSSLSGDGLTLRWKEPYRLRSWSQADRFINAHGTGTENNDAVESEVMKRLFGVPPAFLSAKSNIGHTLGAAGAVEAVYSILNLVHQEIYAGLIYTSDP